MKFYSSFLIRTWLISDPDSAESADKKFVFDIEHIQKGVHVRAATPEEAIELIVAALKSHELDSEEKKQAE